MSAKWHVVEKVPAGPGGWPPAHELIELNHPRWHTFLAFWKFYPVRVRWARAVTCRTACAGPFWDGLTCLTCGRDLPLVPTPPLPGSKKGEVK